MYTNTHIFIFEIMSTRNKILSKKINAKYFESLYNLFVLKTVKAKTINIFRIKNL